MFDVERLYYNEWSVSLSKFKANSFASMIVNGEWEYCPGYGWATEEVALDMTLSMKFMDCYKIILRDLCDFTTNWTGYDARWFDECDQSMDANINLYEKTIRKQRDPTPTAGTIWPVSAEYCKPLPLVTDSATQAGIGKADNVQTRYAKMAYSSIGEYLMTHYKKYIMF